MYNALKFLMRLGLKLYFKAIVSSGQVNLPSKGPVLLVGHQPWLGQVAATVLGLPEASCAVRKAAVWWLRSRAREDQVQTVVMTVACPDLLSRAWDEAA